MASSHLPQYRKFEGYLFNNIIEIYKPQYTISYASETGLYDTGINSMFGDGRLVAKVHCYQQKTSVSLQFEQLGTQYEGTITVVIRHNPDVCKTFGDWRTAHFDDDSEHDNRYLIARYNDDYWHIVNISGDHSHYGSYDYLTLKRTKGVRANG